MPFFVPKAEGLTFGGRNIVTNSSRVEDAMAKVSKYNTWVKELILELMGSQQSAFRGKCSVFFYRMII